MRQDAKTKELRDKALAAIRIEIDADGTATIEAEVDNVALKRLTLERLA
jgi:hypothetical protein